MTPSASSVSTAAFTPLNPRPELPDAVVEALEFEEPDLCTVDLGTK